MHPIPTVQIELALYEEMLARMDFLHKVVNSLFDKLGAKTLSDWVDAEFACNYLNIAPRTFRNYKENGTIGFAKLGNSTRYRGSEVDSLITRET